MANLFELYGTDPDLDAKGAWVDFSKGSEAAGTGAQLRILPDDHPAVKAALAAHHRKYARFYGTGEPIPAEVQLEGEVAVAAAMIADWRNLEGPDGTAGWPCTAANKRTLVEKVRWIRGQVIYVGGRTEAFRRPAALAEAAAELGKSSPPTSAAS